MEKKSKAGKVNIVKAISLMVIVFLVGLVIWLLSSKTEIYETTTYKGTDYATLVCTSSHPEDPFFASEYAQRFTHSVTVLFAGDKLKEMSYRYDGTFDTEMRAENAEAWMHGDYNKYMTANDLYQEKLNPVFSRDKTKLMISLYAEGNKVNSTVGRLFFIGSEEFNDVLDFSSDDYKKFYEKKGFACKMSN